MAKTQRTLVTALTRALREERLEFEREDTEDGSVAVDFILPTQPPSPIRALVLDAHIIVFYLQPGFAVPAERGQATFLWAHETNATLWVGTVEFDAEEGLLFFRHAVDCTHVPDEALGAFLTGSWHLAETVWSSTAASLLPVLLGDDEGESDDENADVGPDGNGSEHTSATGKSSSWRASDDDEDDDDIDDDEDDELTDTVVDLLYHAVEDRFDGDLAEWISGSIANLASTYAEAIRDAEAQEDEIEVTARALGSDERAVLALTAPGVPSLRFRFSPNEMRAQMAHDMAGMTLLHYTSAIEARRILAEGFKDEPLTRTGDYLLDKRGVPYHEADEPDGEGVLLTNMPPPPDDRVTRPVELVVTWGPDAPSIIGHEALETAYAGTEAWLVASPLRRWMVPAQELNEAIQDGLATVGYASAK